MRPLPETTAALRALEYCLIWADARLSDQARRSLTLAVAKTVCGISPELAQVASEEKREHGDEEADKYAMAALSA